MTSDDDRRRADIVGALAAVRSRIAAACEQAARDPRTVTLIAVTKTYPAVDVATLAQLGVLDVGESKDQEARAKVADVAALTDAPVRWHLVGRLQTNKARSVVRYAHAVHSVDRPKLVHALADAAAELRSDPLGVFVQVSIDDDPGRGGATRAEVAALADAIAGREQLRLLGLMAIAPMDADPDVAFTRLAEVSADLRGQYPDAAAVSAGMSGDLESAIRHGATHVRVGTALLGRRTASVG